MKYELRIKKITLVYLIDLIFKEIPKIKSPKLEFGAYLGKLEIRVIRNLLLLVLSTFYFLLSTSSALAGPASSSYELMEYGFGAGGTASSSSESFLFQGTVGEIDTASLSSENYLALSGLTYTLEPNTPGAPTFTNPSNFYNKLNLIINNANNPSDTTFAIQVSSGSANFTSNVYYVQSDHTLGLDPTWQTYSNWNSATGFDLIGLYPGTTYYARVAAKSGVFQQGIWGPSASSATVIPTLTLNIRTTSQASPPYTVNIGNLTPGSVTTSPDTVDTTISTNASNGGLIYLYGSNNGLKSTTANNYNIVSSTTNLTSVTEGYGARGTTVTQTSGGPMQILNPYDGVGNNVGVIDTNKRPISDSSKKPVNQGRISFELKAKASNTTPSANDYIDTLTVIATGSF
jgi:hypothetical protein